MFGTTDPFVVSPARGGDWCGRQNGYVGAEAAEGVSHKQFGHGGEIVSTPLQAQLPASHILRRTAELANAAVDFSEGIGSVQSYLADVFSWEVIGYRLFVGLLPEAEVNVSIYPAEWEAGVSAQPVVLLRIEEEDRLLALLAFCPCSGVVSWEQRAILAEAADQLAVLAQRDGCRQNTLLQAVDLLHQGQLAGMAETAQGLSHELSQPLAALAAYAGAMHRRLSKADVGSIEINYLSERLLEQVERAGEVLQSTKDFLLQHSCATSTTEIGTKLQYLVGLVQQSLRMSAVKLEMDVGSGLPLVRSSEAQLLQIILGLLANAMSVSPVTGKRIVIRAEQVEREVWISVSSDCARSADSGQNNEFGPFYAYADSGQRGLAICRLLAEIQGGRLWSEHSENETVFTVALPVVH